MSTYKKGLVRFFVLPVILALQLIGTNAQPVITLRDSKKTQPIGNYTAYFRDAGFRTIEDVLQPGVQSQFQAYDQAAPNFGSTDDAIWFRFVVARRDDKDFYLQIGSAFIDSIALYAVRDNKVQEVQQSGDNYIFAQRAVHVTTFLFPLQPPPGEQQTYFLRVKTEQPFFFPLRVGRLNAFMEDTHKLDLIQGIYLGFMLLILLYNLFLFFSTREKLYLYYVAYVASITWFMSTVYQYVFEHLWPHSPAINQYAVASTALTILTATLFTREFLQTAKIAPRLHKVSLLFIGWSLLIFILVLTPFKIPALLLAQAGIMCMAIYFLIAGVTVLREGYHPAKFYLLAWSFLILGFIAAILETVNVLPVMHYINSMQIGSAIEVTLLSFALADRINLYKKQREEAQAKALRVAQEKSELIQQQNIQLEQKVAERTMALTQSLDELKSAQAQLIQSEKLASLGQLTAGIAHEIQNPLNFVNNFAAVNNELLAELREAITKGDYKDAVTIAGDLEENERKIAHHGKRADSIVKGMLGHSRTGTGEKQPTNINELTEEYLRLSSQAMRTKDKTFQAAIETSFDENLPKVNVIPQEIGRVILNLLNNAFYAVQQKKTGSNNSYKPVVSVSTCKKDNSIVLKVKDNGPGIPAEVLPKIYQPFFTTKPTGEGTGLGLSLSYDIVTKGHGGEITVTSKEGEGTEFTIHLPAGS